MPRWFALIAAFLVAGCTTVTPADAQSSSAEPPLIAGRLAVSDGDAQIWRVEDDNNAGQWDDAVVNDVVSAGTGLYTGADGRNEVRVGPHTFRLGAASRGGFTQLDYATSIFNLEYGTLNVRLAPPEHGEATSVTVAGVRIDLIAPGRYRIDASDGGPVRLTVFDGHGTVRSANNAFGVGPSQAVVVNPGGSGYSFEAPTTTAFDQWALERDEQYRNVRSAQYVSPYMTGYEALDTYGDWSNDATYGVIWYPRAVPVGWAPYRYGQWRWVRPWGWTWVDAAPWGYAPFHYGRWVMIGPRWCWVPGGYVRQPVWAPALVGFVGSGVSVSVGIGAPLVGWYPLAPWHRYEPHYRHGPRYTTIINQTVIRQPPPGVPRNVTQGPGATLVPGPRFREPIHRVALPVAPKPQELKPAAPPPLNVAPAPRSRTPKFSDQDDRPGRAPPSAVRQPSAPGQPPAQPQPARPQPGGPPPTRVTPPMAVDPMPGRGVAPQPSMPGNDPAPLAQPPGLKRGQPVPPAAAPVAPPPPQRSAPPRPHLPSDQLPPGQQPINPAEPPRFPPGAPPTIRQPQPMVPAARPVQPSRAVEPSQHGPAPAASPPPRGPATATGPGRPTPPAATAPRPPAAAPAPARPAPPAATPAPDRPAPPAARAHPAPSNKEQVLRGPPEQARGNPVEREAPPMRPKQADR